MSNVAKVIEVIGTSETGVEEAIEGAIERAAVTVENMQWFQVTEVRGHIKDQAIDRYQVKIGFGLLDD